MKYADIVIENKSKYTDMFYTYDVGGLDVHPGDLVAVPFGKREKQGYVFSLKDSCELEPEQVKSISSIVTPGRFTEEMIKTAQWMKRRYAIKYTDALRCFSVKGKSAKEGKEKEPYKDIVTDYVKPERLTEEQQEAADTIGKAIEAGENRIFLIHGVTSSGKTEVYMDAIERAIAGGKTAIMLVPEISLTGQAIERFAGRFGKENIAVLHSKLTQRERYDEWERIRNGRVKIVVGARMGVFAPLENIGVIIMDEEHESTYKADMSPKYDTVDIAVKRLQYYNGVLILGSATPSVTSYERAREGIYQLIQLKKRYNRTPLPEVETVDMRKELREGNLSIFSNALFDSMEENLEKGKQIILLQNRRGYSNYMTCRGCGKTLKCRYCHISLTYHKTYESMVCHYCGRKTPVPSKCPECGSDDIKFIGAGTEQIEETVRENFPEAVCDRLDIDTAKTRKDTDRILKRFKKKETDILIGTQLVAKGLDFDNVGLVGVISADSSLNIPDYRSGEKTFQLLTQVAGRAGRGDEQGKVIIQTYEPESFVIKSAENHDYDSFFRQETIIREVMEYPPFGDIIMVNFTSEDEKLSMNTAERCRRYMINAIGTADDRAESRVLSPKIAVNFRGNDTFRHYIIIKCPKGERNRYVYYLDSFSGMLFDEKVNCNVNVDVNPYSII